MTEAYKCRECGAIVDFDSYHPEIRASYPTHIREVYLKLKAEGLCEHCHNDEWLDEHSENLANTLYKHSLLNTILKEVKEKVNNNAM